MTRFWDHTVHDPQLRDLITKWKLTDYEAAHRMQFSAQTVAFYRAKLGLPPNRNPGSAYSAEQRRPLPNDKPNPIALAVACLGVTERDGTYWLGNRPVSTTQMMQAYNRQRIAKGLEQIGPDQWRVKP